MDTRFLRSFLCIAETGSLSRAASALNVVQPALSRQIRLLEEELGTQLLVRHRRGIALTDAGNLLREHAATIVAALDEAQQAVSAAGTEPTGTVSLGLATSMHYVLSPGLVVSFCNRYPRAFLRVYEAFGHVIEEYMRQGKTDVAVLLSPKPMPGIALEPLLKETVCLAGPPEARLSMLEPVPIAMLARVPMIMFPANNKLRLAVEEALEDAGLSLQPKVEIEGRSLAHALVHKGLGYITLPYCAVEAEIAAGRMSGAPIEGITISWELGINRARAGFPAVKAVRDLIRAGVDEQVASGVWRTGMASKKPHRSARPSQKRD